MAVTNQLNSDQVNTTQMHNQIASRNNPGIYYEGQVGTSNFMVSDAVNTPNGLGVITSWRIYHTEDGKITYLLEVKINNTNFSIPFRIDQITK
jgi:hypothetical protein